MKRRSLMSVLLTATLLAVPQLLSAKRKSEEDVNEIGNRKVAHFSIISEEKEVEIGKQYATQIERTAKLVKDPVVTEYVNRVAQNVARNSDLQIPLTVKVIDNPQINAFALPGGFLYVNSGLVLAADEEDQLAGVMAHEIAHVAARHWASQMTKQTILAYSMLPLMLTPMSYPVYMGVSEAMNFGIPIAFLKFSRADEAEADYLWHPIHVQGRLRSELVCGFLREGHTGRAAATRQRTEHLYGSPAHSRSHCEVDRGDQRDTSQAG